MKQWCINNKSVTFAFLCEWSVSVLKVWCGPRVRGAATGRALGTGRRRAPSLSRLSRAVLGSRLVAGARPRSRFLYRGRRRRCREKEGGERGAVRPPIAALVATSRTHPLPPRTAFCYRCVHSREWVRRSFAFRPSTQSPNGRRRTRTRTPNKNLHFDPLSNLNVREKL